MLSGVETRPSEWSGVNAWRLVMDKVSMHERMGRHVQCQWLIRRGGPSSVETSIRYRIEGRIDSSENTS